MELADRARGLAWIRRARAVVARHTGDVTPTAGAGWVQPPLFACADDGTEVADHAEHLAHARQVLEAVETRTGLKPPAETPQDRRDDTATG